MIGLVFDIAGICLLSIGAIFPLSAGALFRPVSVVKRHKRIAWTGLYLSILGFMFQLVGVYQTASTPFR
jgi:hypothetical protein